MLKKIWKNFSCLSVQEVLLLLLFFVLPLQSRIRFPNSQTYLFGNFNNYSVREVYLSDLVFLSLTSVLFFKIVFNKSDFYFSLKNFFLYSLNKFLLFCFLIFLVFSGISIFQAIFKEIALYKFLKLIEFSLLFFLFACLFNKLFFPRLFEKRKLILSVVLLTASFQSLLAINQFFFQQSILFPLLKIIGQPNLNLQEPGISYVSFFGQRLIRAYGTFPHPNVLAAFLLFCLPLFAFLKSNSRWLCFLFFLNLSALFLTFSRAAWLGLFFFIIFLFYQKRKNLALLKTFSLFFSSKIVLILSIFFSSILILFMALRFLSLFNDNVVSFSERFQLANIAIEMILNKPWFGVGLGNFVIALRDYDFIKISELYQQPVHNLFLLIAAETGILSLLAFLGLTFVSLKNFLKNHKLDSYFSLYLFYAFFLFIFLAQFDHYFWNIQQTFLLMGIFLGLINNSKTSFSFLEQKLN